MEERAWSHARTLVGLHISDPVVHSHIERSDRIAVIEDQAADPAQVLSSSLWIEAEASPGNCYLAARPVDDSRAAAGLDLAHTDTEYLPPVDCTAR